MSLYDDRIDTAREFLLKYPADSQEFEAAAEHLKWVDIHGDDIDRARVISALREVHDSRGNEQRALQQLVRFFT
jgi:hypothetical protein